MKQVRYSKDALRSLRKHRNMADRIMKAIREYADDPQAHANRVKRLVASTANRMRVGEYRIIFEETADLITVTKLGPRGSIYDD